MSETPEEQNSNSTSNLIDVQHVGVTAKIKSPLKKLMNQSTSSSTETDSTNLPYNQHIKRSHYDKFSNETQMDTTTTTTTTTTTDFNTESSKLLYEMRATNEGRPVEKPLAKGQPAKIEFQLYHRPTTTKRVKRTLVSAAGGATKRKKSKYQQTKAKKDKYKQRKHEPSLLERLKRSLKNMKESNLPHYYATNGQRFDNSAIFDDLPEPNFGMGRQKHQQDIRIGIYPFEHGCADYLRTTDAHPQIISIALADRATRYATRFWAEFFGTLHIGITFIVTFLLQTYRFLLFTLVNTLLVGFLHMTSDYLIKPILTVLFNGFLQPAMIFIYNILASIRDILTPIAEILNNFMKPIATVGKSLRLINVSNNTRKYLKEV